MMKRKKMISVALSSIIIFSSCSNKNSSKVDEDVQKVIDDIKTIGVVELEDKELITKIEYDYSLLSDEQQKQVTNYKRLKMAREELDKLIKEQEFMEGVRIMNLYTPKPIEGKKEDFLLPVDKYVIGKFFNAFWTAYNKAFLTDTLVNTMDDDILDFVESYLKKDHEKPLYRDFYQLYECHNFYLDYFNYENENDASNDNVITDDIYEAYMEDLDTIFENLIGTYYK